MRTLDQALADFERNPPPPPMRFFSCFKIGISSIDGERDTCGEWQHNLTTTTASGYTNANDWLSKAMGAGPSTAFATATGNATATSATSLTNSGASFPTAGQGLAGCIVVASRNSSGTGATVYGTIVSNSGTVLTIDQWTDPTSTTGAAGTTPNATGAYVILPGQNPAGWMGITSDATTPTTADTSLTSELTTNGFARAVGTWAHTAAGSTYTETHLWTCSGGAGTAINKYAMFGAANPTAGGVMPFESAVPSPPTLLSGDTVQLTITITV